jgi:hypothetical protein
MSGGKTNNGKVPIVNYIAKSPKGAHFLAAVDMGLARRTTRSWPQCMIAFNELCEKIFSGDAVRQTNAVVGLSAFQHGDGMYGREAAKLAASQMPGYRWSQMFSGGHEDSTFPARAVYRPCIVHLPIPH